MIISFTCLNSGHTFQSKSISDAIYESFWYNLEPSDSRILLFIMMRSQKRLTISAGKVLDLSLEGFMSVRCR